MQRPSRLVTTAAVGGLMLLWASASGAQGVSEPGAFSALVGDPAGIVSGVVTDDRGRGLAGAVVTAVGAATSFAVTDVDGRFELRALDPGPYQLRAHLRGHVAPPSRRVQVNSNTRAATNFQLSRAGAVPILAAGVGGAAQAAAPAGEEAAAPEAVSEEELPSHTDHGEVSWRIRHARRGVLRDSSYQEGLLAERAPEEEAGAFDTLLDWAVASPARLAGSFLSDTAFSGQVNLLTAASFDGPERLFSESMSRGVAYVRLGAPVGDNADWAVRGALTQADLSSWIVAGSYATRRPADLRYDVGFSYATQRYDGGNPLALRDVTDGTRNAGAVRGFSTITLSPLVEVRYGARYARYDYLENRGLVSPSLELTLSPSEDWRVRALLSRRAHAPGAEEFLPPGDNGIWLPPQRTFSALERGRTFEAERTTQAALQFERDIAATTFAFTAFQQDVEDQLVTLFGADLPGQPAANLGHYFVGNVGDIHATGCTAEVRAPLAGRVTGAFAYTLTQAQHTPSDDLRYVLLLAPSLVRRGSERVHDFTTSLQADVPETATRVLVLYRASNGFAASVPSADGSAGAPGFDARFDVQVRQSLPFINFSSARWEMLLAVRNFFRESAADQTVYDELLVVRPPKRIVGGVTLHF